MGYWKQSISVRKHERTVESAVQVMTNLSGWSHQVIAQGLWAPPAHSPNIISQPSLHHPRSLEHCGHIGATFPTISSSIILNNASASHDITGCHHPSASLFTRHHHQPHSKKLWASWPKRTIGIHNGILELYSRRTVYVSIVLMPADIQWYAVRLSASYTIIAE